MGIWPFIAGLSVGLIVGFLLACRGATRLVREKVAAGLIRVDGELYCIVKQGTKK